MSSSAGRLLGCGVSVCSTAHGTHIDDALKYVVLSPPRPIESRKRSDLGSIRRAEVSFVWDKSEKEGMGRMHHGRRVVWDVRDGAGGGLLTFGAFGRAAVADWLTSTAWSG